MLRAKAPYFMKEFITLIAIILWCRDDILYCKEHIQDNGDFCAFSAVSALFSNLASGKWPLVMFCIQNYIYL